MRLVPMTYVHTVEWALCAVLSGRTRLNGYKQIWLVTPYTGQAWNTFGDRLGPMCALAQVVSPFRADDCTNASSRGH